MTHLYAELKSQADTAIVDMQDAARHARHLHARAELLRHMHGTAAKPGATVDSVTGEWMRAWGMAHWPEVTAEARRFTQAFLAYTATPTDAADGAIRDAAAALDAALAAQGTTLSDQMAARSRCAHAWWGAVAGAAPFWTAGCPEDCR